MTKPQRWPDGSEQLALLPDLGPAPFVRHSATSKAAATLADASGLVRTARAEVLRLLMDLDQALTDEEMQEALGMNPDTQRPRRVELVELGLVVADGEGLTHSGRRATKWRAREVVE